MNALAMIKDYKGICHICGGEVTKNGHFLCEEIYTNELERHVYSVTPAVCPKCGWRHHYFKVYKDMDVTEEFSRLVKHEHI